MHAPIPTESAPPGKLILPGVHSAEGKGRFKEHVLTVEEGYLAGTSPMPRHCFYLPFFPTFKPICITKSVTMRSKFTKPLATQTLGTRSKPPLYSDVRMQCRLSLSCCFFPPQRKLSVAGYQARPGRQPSRDSMGLALALTSAIRSGSFCFTFKSGTTIEIVARHAPWLSQIGATMQAAEKSDSPAWIDRPASRAAAAGPGKNIVVGLGAASRRGGGRARKYFAALVFRQVTDQHAARCRPIQRTACTDARGDLEMIFHGQHDHMVVVGTADLDGLPRTQRQFVHFLYGDVEQIKRARIG